MLGFASASACHWGSRQSMGQAYNILNRESGGRGAGERKAPIRNSRRNAFESSVDVLGLRCCSPSRAIQNNSGSVKYPPRWLRYRLNAEDAVQIGGRHVNVDLLGMWWRAPVLVLCL